MVKKIKSSMGYKTIKGEKKKYIYVKVYNPKLKKYVVKGFKYRGGKKSVYEKEAMLPDTGKYIVDYRKGTISKDLSKEKDVIKIKTRTKQAKKKRTVKVIQPRRPVHADLIHKLMKNKVFYNAEYSMSDFDTEARDKKFITELLQKSTGNLASAKRLEKQFDKVNTKFSYSVNVYGRDILTNDVNVIGSMHVTGLRPVQISKAMKMAGIVTGEKLDLRDTDENSMQYQIKETLSSLGVSRSSIRLERGQYQVTDVTFKMKFYNNPAYTLKRFS